SRKRLPTIEGAQATSGTPCRSTSTSNEKLNSQRPCSSSQRRVTSTAATAASQCSTKSGTSPYITAAVLASAFAVTAEHILFLGLYVTSFVINLILDMVHGP